MPLLVSCPACGLQISNLAESCQQCGHPVARDILSGKAGEVAGQLRAVKDNLAAQKRKVGVALRTAAGACEKTAAGCLLVGLFQVNEKAYLAALGFFFTSLVLNHLASD
ncbi:MAG: hypothetical protein LBQ79_01585 [Deltaproteobacteria bacterium]|jgi:hypothetical protein|nr:hypothetical protein [Deltaproteobacteria bacterium]